MRESTIKYTLIEDQVHRQKNVVKYSAYWHHTAPTWDGFITKQHRPFPLIDCLSITHFSLTDRPVQLPRGNYEKPTSSIKCVFSSLQFHYVAVSLTAHSTFFPDCQPQGAVNTISVAFWCFSYKQQGRPDSPAICCRKLRPPDLNTISASWVKSRGQIVPDCFHSQASNTAAFTQHIKMPTITTTHNKGRDITGEKYVCES